MKGMEGIPFVTIVLNCRPPTQRRSSRSTITVEASRRRAMEKRYWGLYCINCMDSGSINCIA